MLLGGEERWTAQQRKRGTDEKEERRGRLETRAKLSGILRVQTSRMANND